MSEQYIKDLAALSPFEFHKALDKAVSELKMSKTAIKECVKDAQRAAKAEHKAVVAHRKVQLDIGSDLEIANLAKQSMDSDPKRLFVYSEGSFYQWDEKKWQEQPDSIIQNEFIHKYDGAYYGDKSRYRFNEGKTRSVYQYLTTEAELGYETFFKFRPLGINLHNGFLSFENGKPQLLEHRPDQLNRTVHSGSYDPTFRELPKDSLLYRYVDTICRDDDESEIKTMLRQEIAGTALIGSPKGLVSQPKAIFLHGTQGNNGKSEFLFLLEGLAGSDATSHVAPADFSNMNMVKDIRGKLLNVSGEIDTAEPIASNVFKNMITHETIHGKSLYKDVFDFISQAQQVYSTNGLPRGKLDMGVRRRLLVNPFYGTIKPSDMIPDIAKKILTHEYELLLNWAIAGVARLISQGKFSEPKDSIAALNKWVQDTDNVSAFIKDRCTYRAGVEGCTPAEAYNIYHAYCEQNHIPVHFRTGRPEFINRMADHFVPLGVPFFSKTGQTAVRNWAGLIISDHDLIDLETELKNADDNLPGLLHDLYKIDNKS